MQIFTSRSSKPKKTIKRKIIMYFSLIFLGFLLVLTGFLSDRFNAMSYKARIINMQDLSENMKNYTLSIMNDVYGANLALAKAFESVKVMHAQYRRDYLNLLQKKVLLSSDNFIDVWTVWKENALDGLDMFYKNSKNHDATGRFIPYWTRIDGKIDVTALTDYEGSFWYEDPLKTKMGILIEPNNYQLQGRMMYVAGTAIPVYDDDGNALAVVGIDYSLKEMQNKISSMKFLQTGFPILISAGGTVLVHKDKKLLTKTLPDFQGGEFKSLFTQATKDLKSFQFEKKIDGATHLYFFSPVKLKHTAEVWFVGISVPKLEIYALTKPLIYTIVISSFLGGLLFIVLLYFLTDRITKNIGRIVEVLAKIAKDEGDLTARLPLDGNDEITQLSDYFNQTIAKIQDIAVNARSTSSQNASIATQLSYTSMEVITRVEDEIELVKSTVESGEKTIQNIDLIIDSADADSDQLQKAGESLEKVNQEVSHLNLTFKDTAQKSEVLAQRLNDTSKRTEKIRSVLTVINEIADQTNLLALNAAIEAARAGEHGRGFAVVADEVRNLAEHTQTSLAEINSTINEIVQEINIISKDLSSTTTNIEDISQMSELLQQNVSENNRIIQTSIQANMRNIEDYKNTAEYIQKLIEKVKKIEDLALNNARSIEEVSLASDNLSSSTLDLDNQLSKFKI